MNAHNPLDNGQTQASTTATGLLTRRISAIEALKKMRKMLWGDTDPRVTNHQLNLVLPGSHAQRNLSPRVGKTQRVLQQVHDHLDQASFISHERHWLLDVGSELNVPFLGQWVQRGSRRLGEQI